MKRTMSTKPLDVDICSAIISDKPPQLPLREELNSLGFEVVLAAAGTGIRASKYESKIAVKKYRRLVATKDLKRSRFFPKSSKRIKQTLVERARVEQVLAVPHACSYETYEIKLRSSSAFSSDSQNSSSDSCSSASETKLQWGMFKRRLRHSKQKNREEHNAIKVNNQDFHQIATQAVFPDFLAPVDEPSKVTLHDDSTRTSNCVANNDSFSQRDVWKNAFDALDEADLYETPRSKYQNMRRLVVEATDHDNEVDYVPNVFGVFENLDDDVLPKDSGTTNVFDGIDIPYQSSALSSSDSSNDFTSDGDKSSRKPDLDLKKIESRRKRKLEKSKFDSPFANAPEDSYDSAGSRIQDEKKEDTPSPSVDGSFAITLAQSGSLRASTPQSFDDDREDFSQAASTVDGEGAATSLRVIIGEGDEFNSEAGDVPLKHESLATVETTGIDVVETAGIEVAESSGNDVEQPVKVDVATPMSAFERATAEILRVAGIETETPKAEVSSVEKPLEENSAIAWMTSAKHVLDNISAEMFKATGLDRNDQEPASPKNEQLQATVEKNDGRYCVDDISTLFAALARHDVTTGGIENILVTSPELPQVRRQQDGRLPLHALCDRGLPDRSSVAVGSVSNFLLEDIASYKNLIRFIFDFYPNASLVQDKKLDLPVHLIARRLMEWEATWYEIVYQKAAKEKDPTGTTAIVITKLYQTMSESIEMLLQPILENRELCSTLCRAPGSMGTILPLHIASIFTVSVKCLRLILEAYPEGATVHCDLGILQTFIPDECLPLELHDNLSTDFPKWEIEVKRDSNSEEIDGNAEDSMRRSDLMFAYNPIEPHRLEKARIRRIETRLQYDAAIIAGKTTRRLDRANELLWIWMCTFQERDTDRPTYVNSVKRIVSALSLQALRYLVSVKTKAGVLLIDVANEECLKIIQRRLEQIAGSKTTNSTPETESGIQANDATIHQNQEKEFVSHLCRLVFHVPEMPYPTSFIVLPYKLIKDEDGALRLASPNFTRVATKFAECLLSLTDPRSILYMLDSKSTRHYGQSVFDPSIGDSFHLQSLASMNRFEDTLLALFESGDGYLYLIDETTGLPQVDNSDTVYPIVLSSPTNLVQKLLPLMMMGMVQMRGDKAISKLASVILDESVTTVVPSWMEAADLLIAHLNLLESLGPDLHQVKNSLTTFRSISASKQRTARPKNGITEWNSELSMLKMLIEMNDPERQFSGLIAPSQANCFFGQEAESDSISYNDNILMQRDEHETSYANSSSIQSTAASRSRPEPDIIDLARKMDELSVLQHSVTGGKSGKSSVDYSRSPSPIFDDDSFLIGKSFSVADDFSRPEFRNVDDKPQSRKHMISRYSILFDDLSVTNQNRNIEGSDEAESNETEGGEVRVWNSVDRVWEDVTSQLNSRTETFCEDSQILHLKVALAEQAKKLSELGKKVSLLKDEERRLASHETEIYDLTHVHDSDESEFVTHDSLSNARKLVLRMGDLEERLICDEIEIQHLTMEAFSVQCERDDMATQSREPEPAWRHAPRVPCLVPQKNEEPLILDTKDVPTTSVARFKSLNREVSGIAWGNGCKDVNDLSERSFLRYEKRKPKVVRFNDEWEREGEFDEGFITPPQNSPNHSETLNSVVVINDDYSESESWQLRKDVSFVPQPTPLIHEESSATGSDGSFSFEVVHVTPSQSSSPRRDPDGTYVGEVMSKEAHVHFLMTMKGPTSEGSSAYEERLSSQEVAYVSTPKSDRNLSADALIWGSPVTVSTSAIDAEASTRTDEGSLSFQSPLLTTLMVPLHENSLDKLEIARSSSMQNDDYISDNWTRSQKLIATKKKGFVPKLRQVLSDSEGSLSRYERLYAGGRSDDSRLREQPRGLEIRMVGNTYAVYDQAFPWNGATESATESTTASSVFRPTKNISFSGQLSVHDCSALSSDRSFASEMQAHRKVMDIETLILKYTSAARGTLAEF